jgi:hypothetical protein
MESSDIQISHIHITHPLHLGYPKYCQSGAQSNSARHHGMVICSFDKETIKAYANGCVETGMHL